MRVGGRARAASSVVGADHALAARAVDRLQHPGEPGSRPGRADRRQRRTNAGCGTSAAASARRIAALSRVAATASGGLWGNPRRSPAAAATITPRSSTATTASTAPPVVEGHDQLRGGVGLVAGAPPSPARPCRPSMTMGTRRSPPRPRPRAGRPPGRSRGPGRSMWGAGGARGHGSYHGG